MIPTPEQRLKRALWLAFEASRAVGMGMLHTGHAAQITEDSLYDACKKEQNKIYTDYVAGRMMKTSFKLSDDGTLSVTPETPRPDYQSWAGTYSIAKELIEAVDKSFAEESK